MPLFPDFVLWFLIAILVTVGTMLTAAVLFPPELLGPAAPLDPAGHVSPPWYLLPARGVLRGAPGAPGFLFLVGGLLLLLLLPAIDPGPAQTRRGVFVRWGIGLLAAIVTVFLGLRGRIP